MSADELMAKAIQACRSAQLLLDAGDADGACNRAYYAMFDAARAALIAAGGDIGIEAVRTHGGLITAFSLHLVKSGRVPVELGRSFNRMEEIRLVADYRGEVVDRSQAWWAVEQAIEFVEFVRREFAMNPSVP